MPPVAAITGCRTVWGRCIMARSGVFYAVKAMERVAAGTAADDVAGRPGRRAVARSPRPAARREGSIACLARRVLAAARFGMADGRGEAGQGSRRLGGAAGAD